MFSKKSQFKASTLCASSALLVLGGFMAINLAGCGGGGGGGGGGGFGSPTPTPGPQNITFRLVRQNQAASNGGTVTLTSSTGTVLTTSATSSGIATLSNVPAGTYTVKFTVLDENGAVVNTTTSTLNITRQSGQTYLLLQDAGAGSVGAFTISGTIRINPRATITPTPTTAPTATATPTATAAPTATGTPIATGTPTATGTPLPTATKAPTSTPAPTPDPFQFSTCTTSSDPVNGPILVEVIDLNTALGRPIVAQLNRRASAANNGAFTITVPYSSFQGRESTFQVRVGQFDKSGAAYAGFSAAFNFNGSTTVSGLLVCANENGIAPQIPPTTTFTPTPRPTFIILGQ